MLSSENNQFPSNRNSQAYKPLNESKYDCKGNTLFLYE